MTDFFKLQDKEENELTLANAYNTDLTDVFYEDIKFSVTPPNPKLEERPLRSIVLDIKSKRLPRGSGKSSVGLTVAWEIIKHNHVKIDVKRNIHFTIQELSAQVEHSKIGETFILDETRRGEQFGTSAMYNLARLSDLTNVSRAYGLNMIIIGVPEVLGFMDYKPDYILSADGIDMDKRENMCIVYDFDTQQPRGFIIIKRPSDPEFEIFWKKYYAKKMEFIKTNLIGSFKDRTKERMEKVKKLLTNSDFEICRNDTERQWIFEDMFGAEIPINEQKMIIKRAVFELRKARPELFEKKKVKKV